MIIITLFLYLFIILLEIPFMYMLYVCMYFDVYIISKPLSTIGLIITVNIIFVFFIFYFKYMYIIF